MHHPRIDLLRTTISAHRDKLVEHKVYSELTSLDDLREFMEHHVFAVWDFMSLLKYLQRELTCVSVPWMPKGDASVRYLINEIVTGEESDVDPSGNRISHFELYLEAMRMVGADTLPITRFIHSLSEGMAVDEALKSCGGPQGALDFVRNTFRTLESNRTHAIAAVFTFGREDLIPDMFLKLIKGLQHDFPGKIDLVRYYVERHIEVDGGHHGELALQMTAQLCGEDEKKWIAAEQEVISALESRAALWDSILVSCTLNRVQAVV